MKNISSSIKNTEYERWQLPKVSNSDIALYGTTVEKLELIQKQAYQEGISKAYKEKSQELTNNINSLRFIIELLTEPLKDIDDEIVQQLADLSMIVAKQVIRRELHTEQGEIVGIVREAMTALPASTRKIILNIHPDDSELIRHAFSLGQEDDSDELRWKLVEDPMITRGGCKISSENSRIDATIEARLNRVISTLLGGERESDS